MRRAALAILALSSSHAFAEPFVLEGQFDRTRGPNQYVVDFSTLGGTTLIMEIRGGSFRLEVDSEAASARLLSWSQQIDAIEIVPGLSTGPMSVSLGGDSATPGVFDPSTRQFSVSATFVLEFDDSELREYGFTSPMEIVGVEQGSMYGAGSAESAIRMYLSGTGSSQDREFPYTCETTSTFEYVLEESRARSGDVNRDRGLDLSDPVAILGELFAGVPTSCPSAADVNRDGATDISDPVYLLNFLFLGGSEPPLEPVRCE